MASGSNQKSVRGYAVDSNGEYAKHCTSDDEQPDNEINKYGAGHEGGRGKRNKTLSDVAKNYLTGKEYIAATTTRPQALGSQWPTTIIGNGAKSNGVETFLVVHDGCDGEPELLTGNGIRMKSARLRQEETERNQSTRGVESKPEESITAINFMSKYSPEILGILSNSFLERLVYQFKRAIEKKRLTQGQNGVSYHPRISFEMDDKIDVIFHALAHVLDLRSLTLGALVQSGAKGLCTTCNIDDLDHILRPICKDWWFITDEQGWISQVEKNVNDPQKKSDCRLHFTSYASKTCRHEKECPGCMEFVNPVAAAQGVVHTHKFVREGDYFRGVVNFSFMHAYIDDTVTGRMTSRKN